MNYPFKVWLDVAGETCKDESRAVVLTLSRPDPGEAAEIFVEDLLSYPDYKHLLGVSVKVHVKADGYGESFVFDVESEATIVCTAYEAND